MHLFYSSTCCSNELPLPVPPTLPRILRSSTLILSPEPSVATSKSSPPADAHSSLPPSLQSSSQATTKSRGTAVVARPGVEAKATEAVQSWLPVLHAPPWPSGLSAPPWLQWLPLLPEFPDPPWLPVLPALRWLLGLFALPWLPELPDPPWLIRLH
ncbi:hypothetical protein M9458_007369, partial [Cirrhinus mrigala]